MFSRYMFAEAIKNCSKEEGLRGTKAILKKAKTPVENITVDKGSEFVSKKYQNYIKSLNTKLHYTNCKASIAERAILTLKQRIYRFFAETDDLKYIDKLADFVQGYNHHFHRFLQMSPHEGEKKVNAEKVLQRHLKKEREIYSKRQKPQYKIGDRVRLSRIKNRMTRGYDNTFNYEIFKIVHIDTNLPIPRYYVQQPDTGEDIIGCFYGNELVVVRQDRYKVIIHKKRTRKGIKEVYIGWKGYPGK